VSVDIEKRRADRLRVMGAIFHAANGSETEIVRIARLERGLGLSEQDIMTACHYLIGERLITASIKVEGDYIVGVQITHQGVREMERRLQTARESARLSPSSADVLRQPVRGWFGDDGGLSHAVDPNRLNITLCGKPEPFTRPDIDDPWITAPTPRCQRCQQAFASRAQTGQSSGHSASSIVIFHGDVINSPIQNGSPGAQQEVSAQESIEK
jgi:hypothetical protein